MTTNAKNKSGTVAVGSELMNRSSEKMFSVMECLAANRFPMRLQDIAASLQMSQSTVLRYLNSMIQNNYVYQEKDSSRYGLTLKICSLAERMNSPLQIRTIASPIISNLAYTLNVGICIVIEEFDQAIYLDLVDDPDMMKSMRTLKRIGKSAPMYSTSSGKLFLSQKTEAELDDYMQRCPLDELTPYTIRSRQTLFSELEAIRKNDCAFDNEECEIGIKCAAVPVRNYSGRIAMSLSVFSSPEKLPDDYLKNQVLPLLRQNAAELSVRMGFEGEYPL